LPAQQSSLQSEVPNTAALETQQNHQGFSPIAFRPEIGHLSQQAMPSDSEV